jgi:hypothetical protein
MAVADRCGDDANRRSWPRVMTTPSEGVAPGPAGLTPFQIDVARAFFDLPESQEFLISGGPGSWPKASQRGRLRIWTSSPCRAGIGYPSRVKH